MFKNHIIELLTTLAKIQETISSQKLKIVGPKMHEIMIILIIITVMEKESVENRQEIGIRDSYTIAEPPLNGRLFFLACSVD